MLNSSPLPNHVSDLFGINWSLLSWFKKTNWLNHLDNYFYPFVWHQRIFINESKIIQLTNICIIFVIKFNIITICLVIFGSKYTYIIPLLVYCIADITSLMNFKISFHTVSFFFNKFFIYLNCIKYFNYNS